MPVTPTWIIWDASVADTVLTAAQAPAAVGNTVSTWKNNAGETLSLVGSPNCTLIRDAAFNNRPGVSKNDTTSLLYYPNPARQYHDRTFMMVFRRLNDSLSTAAAAYIFAYRSRNVAPIGSFMIFVVNVTVYIQFHRNHNGTPTVATVILGTLDANKFTSLALQFTSNIGNSFNLKWASTSNKTLQSTSAFSGSMAPLTTWVQPTTFGGISSTDGTGQYLPGVWTGGQCAVVLYEMRISLAKLSDTELQTAYNSLDAKWANW